MLAVLQQVKSDAEDDPTDSSQRSCECPGKDGACSSRWNGSDFVTVLQDEVPGGWLPEQHVQYSEAGRMLSP